MTHDIEERTIGKILEKLENIERNFVSKQEFLPIKILVYGFVGIVLTSVIGLMVASVLVDKSTAKEANAEVIK